MKQEKNRAKWLQVGLLGLALWIVSGAGLPLNNCERFLGSESEAIAQDLSGSWVSLTQNCKWPNGVLQCKISGKFKVQNQSPLKALSSKVRFFLSDDSTLEETNDILLKEMKVGSLNAGQSKTISLQINLPLGNSASDQFVIGLVDADNSVPEENEANNLTSSDMIPSGTEFFPFALGDAWTFQGTISGNIGPVGSYVNTRMVTGNKVINGETTTVFKESNPANAGIPIEEYLVKDIEGITYWGSSGETGLFPSQMIPFQRVYFPLQLKSAIKQSFKGIDLGQDLDGDGVNETANVTATVTVAAFEEVTVPAGSFPNSVRIDTKGAVNVTLSAYHRNIRLNVIQKEWFAYEVGLVKRTVVVTAQISGQQFTEEMTEELMEFSKGGAESCIEPPAGLISWWPGDGNTNDIVGSNDGMLQNGVTFANGMVGQAFSFDGVDDYVSGGTTTGFPLGSSPRTITAWIKAAGITPGWDSIIFHYGVGNADFPPTNFHLAMYRDGRAVIGNGFGYGMAFGTTELNDGQFHFLAGVYEGPSTNLARIYVDGIEEGSTVIITPSTLEGGFKIGNELPAYNQLPFHGLIDEVEIYNRALSTAEIQAIFLAGKGGKCKR